MSFYETLYIVDPNLENKSLEKTMIEIGKELEKTKSYNFRFSLHGIEIISDIPNPVILTLSKFV